MKASFPSVYCPLELNYFLAQFSRKVCVVWTVLFSTSFYSLVKVKVERVCVLRALTAEKVPLRSHSVVSLSHVRSTLALCILHGLKKPARPRFWGHVQQPALFSPSDWVEQGLWTYMNLSVLYLLGGWV